MSFLENNKDRKEKSKSVVVTGRVSEDVYDKFKAICDSAGFSVSEAVRLLVINEVTPKKSTSQQTPRPTPQPVPTTNYEPKPIQSYTRPVQDKPVRSFNPTVSPSNLARFTTNRWKFNNMLPCPICNEWMSATNFSRHAKMTHDSTTKDIFTEYPDKADEMVKEVNSQVQK